MNLELYRETGVNLMVFLEENRFAENRVRGNVCCFLAAVATSLLFDYSYLTNVKRIQERVLQRLIENGNLYDGFHNGTAAMLVMDALNFFEDRLQWVTCGYIGFGNS